MSLISCDSKTLQGLTEKDKKEAVPERSLPARGEATADLWKMRGAIYRLKSAAITAWSAEFTSKALFVHELDVPGVIQKTRDKFSGKKQWAVQDTTQQIHVNLCIPAKIDLTKGNKNRGTTTCVKYHPKVVHENFTFDTWPVEQGLPVFDVFLSPNQDGDFYTLQMPAKGPTNLPTDNDLYTATIRSNPDGGIQILEQIQRALPQGKPGIGEVAKYFVELNYGSE